MHVDHLAGVAVWRAAAGVGGQAGRGSRSGVDWWERKPERLPGLCGGYSFSGIGRSSPQTWGNRYSRLLSEEAGQAGQASDSSASRVARRHST
jgi:hypothetical protein